MLVNPGEVRWLPIAKRKRTVSLQIDDSHTLSRTGDGNISVIQREVTVVIGVGTRRELNFYRSGGGCSSQGSLDASTGILSSTCYGGTTNTDV